MKILIVLNIILTIIFVMLVSGPKAQSLVTEIHVETLKCIKIESNVCTEYRVYNVIDF